MVGNILNLICGYLLILVLKVIYLYAIVIINIRLFISFKNIKPEIWVHNLISFKFIFNIKFYGIN